MKLLFYNIMNPVKKQRKHLELLQKYRTYLMEVFTASSGGGNEMSAAGQKVHGITQIKSKDLVQKSQF